MQLAVAITLSDEDAHNPDNSFECRVVDALTGKVVGGHVWSGSSESLTVIPFGETGDFVDELVEVDIEIASEIAFDYTLDVEVE